MLRCRDDCLDGILEILWVVVLVLALPANTGSSWQTARLSSYFKPVDWYIVTLMHLLQINKRPPCLLQLWDMRISFGDTGAT
jgi:hypothetical protein